VIDKDYYSHDAYLKLIEDLFAGSNRIAKNDDGTTRDGRQVVREEATFENEPGSGIGNLLNEFDFNENRTFVNTTALKAMKCYVGS
jgi:hypothetical protein